MCRSREVDVGVTLAKCRGGKLPKSSEEEATLNFDVAKHQNEDKDQNYVDCS